MQVSAEGVEGGTQAATVPQLWSSLGKCDKVKGNQQKLSYRRVEMWRREMSRNSVILSDRISRPCRSNNRRTQATESQCQGLGGFICYRFRSFQAPLIPSVTGSGITSLGAHAFVPWAFVLSCGCSVGEAACGAEFMRD